MASGFTGKILGKYKLYERITSAGMADVYKAHPIDETLTPEDRKKTFVVKVAQNDETIERFRHEMRLHGELEHPNIVKIYGRHQTDDGVVFFVMDYYAGGSLKAYIQRHVKGMSISETLHILEEVARALDYIHRKGIIHRDIKPANILLNASVPPNAFLTDFGIVKSLDEHAINMTTTGFALGTFAYMPPEVLNPTPNTPISAASDLYAFGLVAYQMLTGVGEEFLSAWRGRWLTFTREDIPKEAETVINKVIAFDPNDRYKSAGVFVEALRKTLQNAPVIDAPPVAPTASSAQDTDPSTRPIPIIAPQANTTRRSALFAAGGVLALALILLAWQFNNGGILPTPTETITPTTEAIVAIATNTATLTPTDTPVTPTTTSTPTDTPTNTITPSPLPPTNTPTRRPTRTPNPTNTTAPPTNTATRRPTNTPAPSATLSNAARIALDPCVVQTSNNAIQLYAAAGKNQQIVGQLPVAEAFQVLHEQMLMNGEIWWQIATEGTSLAQLTGGAWLERDQRVTFSGECGLVAPYQSPQTSADDSRLNVSHNARLSPENATQTPTLEACARAGTTAQAGLGIALLPDRSGFGVPIYAQPNRDTVLDVITTGTKLKLGEGMPFSIYCFYRVSGGWVASNDIE